MMFRILTVLAVIGLAVSTWILSNPGAPPAQSSANPVDSPGYYLKNAVLTDYDAAGDPSVRIEAERIDQIGHSNEVALVNVQINYQAPGGQSWVMIGDTAHVQSGGKVVDISGNVRLQGVDREHPGTAIIRTDTLSYDIPNEVASTQSDVRIEFARHTLTARGLVANLQAHTVRLESRVNGRFLP
ncbi:MAG: LPS export ABC transporter periplasmic protein LptC [Steroidobacteraceae bacterium]|jgi:lipopolysaccharide export system protein LptC